MHLKIVLEMNWYIETTRKTGTLTAELPFLQISGQKCSFCEYIACISINHVLLITHQGKVTFFLFVCDQSTFKLNTLFIQDDSCPVNFLQGGYLKQYAKK